MKKSPIQLMQGPGEGPDSLKQVHIKNEKVFVL